MQEPSSISHAVSSIEDFFASPPTPRNYGENMGDVVLHIDQDWLNRYMDLGLDEDVL